MSAAMMNRLRTLQLERDTAWRVYADLATDAEDVVEEMLDQIASVPGGEAKAAALRQRFDAKYEGAGDALDRFVQAMRQIEAESAGQPLAEKHGA